MGSLKHFWNNPYASLKAKQLIFLAMPANQLLWGCKSCALSRSHIAKLEVFWHRSIQRILWIGIGQVIKEGITNERIRKIFFNVPTAENTIVVRQMNYTAAETTQFWAWLAPNRAQNCATQEILTNCSAMFSQNCTELFQNLFVIIPSYVQFWLLIPKIRRNIFLIREIQNSDLIYGFFWLSQEVTKIDLLLLKKKTKQHRVVMLFSLSKNAHLS